MTLLCFVQVANCVQIGLPMLIILVITQYLKRIIHFSHVILERYGLLICIGIVWAFAAILTAAGAYNNVKEETKQNCRTDHSFLISSAPWYVRIIGLSVCRWSHYSLS